MVIILIPESSQTLFKYLCQDFKVIKILELGKILKKLSKKNCIVFLLPLLYLDVLNKTKSKINPDFEKDVFENHSIIESFGSEKTFKIIEFNCKPNTDNFTTIPCP